MVARRFESVNIKGTIATLNQMQADGIIERYAIGGAVGATFYLDKPPQDQFVIKAHNSA